MEVPMDSVVHFEMPHDDRNAAIAANVEIAIARSPIGRDHRGLQ